VHEAAGCRRDPGAISDNGGVRTSRLLAALALTAASVGIGLVGPGAGPASAATVDVTMGTDNRYLPPVVTVTAGDTVKWTHVGGTAHTVTFADGSPGSPDPMLPPPGTNTFSRTFPAPGTFQYSCRYHGAVGMTGQVVVQAASPPTTAAPPPTTVPPPTTTTTRPRSTTTAAPTPPAGSSGPPPLSLPLDPVPTTAPPGGTLMPSPFGTTIPTQPGFLPPRAGPGATAEDPDGVALPPTKPVAANRRAAGILLPLGMVVAVAAGGLAFRRSRDRRALETW
jgi:plastocyanin